MIFHLAVKHTYKIAMFNMKYTFKIAMFNIIILSYTPSNTQPLSPLHLLDHSLTQNVRNISVHTCKICLSIFQAFYQYIRQLCLILS